MNVLCTAPLLFVARRIDLFSNRRVVQWNSKVRRLEESSSAVPPCSLFASDKITNFCWFLDHKCIMYLTIDISLYKRSFSTPCLKCFSAIVSLYWKFNVLESKLQVFLKETVLNVLLKTLSDYTDLAMSTVTQTLAIPYTGPFNLLFYQLQKLTGRYSERNVCGLFLKQIPVFWVLEWKFLCSEVPQFVLCFMAFIR